VIGLKGGTLVSSEQVDIEIVIRPMRGRSRSVLAIGNDQHYYVVKQAGDTFRNRQLANECLGHSVLTALGISRPEIRIVRVGDAETLSIRSKDVASTLSNGSHFGSRLPTDPTQAMIYDFVPAKLMYKVANLNEFATVFAIDTWLSNAAARQQVFVFESMEDGSRRLKAFFIDNDEILCGARWRIDKSHVDMRLRDSKSVRDLPIQDLCSAAARAIAKLDMRQIEQQTIALSQQWLSVEEKLILVDRLHQLAETREQLAQDVETMLTACSRITSIACGTSANASDTPQKIAPLSETLIAPVFKRQA
jgi:HipA-like protein